MNRLRGLEDFPFLAVQIGHEVDEEQVAEIFLRVNSGGTSLTQADFILTMVEDKGGVARLRDIRYRFGPDVAEIVRACSDTMVETGTDKSPWWERKRAYLDHLRSLEDPLKQSVLRVTMADKLFNLRAIRRDVEQSNDREAFWALFTTGAEGQLWYYGCLATIFAAHDLESPIVREIGRLLQEIRDIAPEAASRVAVLGSSVPVK